MSVAEPGDRTVASFLRGLTIGALIGAVIAGSSLWSRRRRRRRADQARPRRRGHDAVASVLRSSGLIGPIPGCPGGSHRPGRLRLGFDRVTGQAQIGQVQPVKASSLAASLGDQLARVSRLPHFAHSDKTMTRSPGLRVRSRA